MSPKYAVPEPVEMTERTWPSRRITAAPVWCAVDLRDGNQALPDPLTPQQKKEYFDLLTRIGFKQIEIGFPSASADDFEFCRALIEEGRIPEDVTISVLTQAREPLIRRTFEALKGVEKAICHVYTATSDLHMRFVFGKDRRQTHDMALQSIALIRQLADQALAEDRSDIGLQFSPEEFTDSDLDFVVALCDDVVETWSPKDGESVILNLPATVERRPPNEYADMIEEFIRRQKHRDRSVISLHTHNDMGTAVASTEMSLMAGADRVEGTLLGHGERSGNVDLVTLALNLQYMGIDTGLDFSNLEQIVAEVVKLTGMGVHPRHPYAGELVFTAFSGSHQDAIHKGLTRRKELEDFFGAWKIPYLHIGPQDLGRSFEKFIRINSQSGKGGIAHVLEQDYGVRPPRELLIELSRKVQEYADKKAREVESREVWDIFTGEYMRSAPLELVNYWPRPSAEDPSQIDGEAHVRHKGELAKLSGSGGGPISAFARAIRHLPLPTFTLEEYEEDAIGNTADAEAIAFIRLRREEEGSAWGVGTGSNIDQAAVRAIVSALNRLETAAA